MTKAELIALLAAIPDDAEVLVRAVATSNDFTQMCNQAKADQEGDALTAELSEITGVDVNEADGSDAPAFAVIAHHVEYHN